MDDRSRLVELVAAFRALPDPVWQSESAPGRLVAWGDDVQAHTGTASPSLVLRFTQLAIRGAVGFGYDAADGLRAWLTALRAFLREHHDPRLEPYEIDVFRSPQLTECKAIALADVHRPKPLRSWITPPASLPTIDQLKAWAAATKKEFAAIKEELAAWKQEAIDERRATDRQREPLVRAPLLVHPTDDGFEVVNSDVERLKHAACVSAGVARVWCGVLPRDASDIREKGSYDRIDRVSQASADFCDALVTRAIAATASAPAAAAPASPPEPPQGKASRELVKWRQGLLHQYRRRRGISTDVLAEELGTNKRAIQGVAAEDWSRFDGELQEKLLTAISVSRAQWYTGPTKPIAT